MKLLILGGTLFLGRHVAEIALSRGHEVTLFNRGKRNPELFPDAEHLVGDRNGDLGALTGRSWDCVIDTCGYVPRIVALSAELLKDSADYYMFVSSVSVYSELSKENVDETGAVGVLDDPTIEVIDGETYGPLKALCEEAALSRFEGRSCVIRPGLIVGPHDPTDRYTYWPVRIHRGGEVLVPADGSVPVQIIDVRDLAHWMVDLAETKTTGIFNAVGPAETLSFDAMISACVADGQSMPALARVKEDWLEANEVQAWSDLPVWIPDTADVRGVSRIDGSRAIGAGLKLRPVSETAADTLSWALSRPIDYVLKAGLPSVREAELLKLWHAEADAHR